MTLYTLRPNAYEGTDPGASPSGTAVTAMSDNLDTTYVSRSTGNSDMRFDLTTVTKPVGAVLKYVQSRVRAGPQSGSCKLAFHAQINGGLNTSEQTGITINGITTVEGPQSTAYGDLSQTNIDSLELEVNAVSPTNSNVNFREGYLDVVFALIPVADVLTPTGTVTVSNVPGTWTHTEGCSHGGAQTHYEAKVFSAAQYGAGGFNPDTSAAEWVSGVVVSSTHGATALGLGAGAHRWYVRTAETINGTPHWSAWNFEAFTVSLTTSEVLTVTPVADVPNGRVVITTAINPVTDTAAIADVERSEAVDLLAGIPLSVTDAGSGDGPLAIGWNRALIGTPTAVAMTVGVSGTQGSRAYQKMAATLDAGDAVYFRPATTLPHGAGVLLWPVKAGDVVSFGIDLRATAAIPAGIEYYIWITFDAISDSLKQLTIPASSTTWRRYEHSAVAPVDCDMRINVSMNGISGVALVANVDMAEPRVTINDEWVPVRFARDYPVVADSLVTADYEASPGAPVRYRARAVKADGSTGRWVEQTGGTAGTGTTTWDPADIWYKNPLNSAENVAVDWEGPVDVIEDIVQGEFYPYGSKYAIVVSEVRQARTGEWLIRTSDDDQVAALRKLMNRPTVLVHVPSDFRFPPGYFSHGRLEELHLVDRRDSVVRNWKVPFREVARP